MKALRASSGLSQAELSFLSGVPKKTLQGLEQGLRVPTLEAAAKMLAAMGLEPGLLADTQWIEEVAASIARGIPERKPGGRPRKE